MIPSGRFPSERSRPVGSSLDGMWEVVRARWIISQVIKTFSMREGWWYIGIKGGGGVKSKGTRIVIEKEKRNRPILAACRHV